MLGERRGSPLYPLQQNAREQSRKIVWLVAIAFSLIFYEKIEECLGEVHINDVLKQYIMGHATGTTLRPHSLGSPVIQLIRSYLQ